MVFPAIEHFRDKDLFRQRFQRQGWMLPENVARQASCIDSRSAACCQVIEVPNRQALRPWIERWNDNIDFEVASVIASREFWERVGPKDPRVADLD